MKTATVLRHVHFEDLGTLAPVLDELGYQVEYRSPGKPDFLSFDPLEPALLVILGGPIGVYEDAAYPFVVQERDLIGTRLASGLPTIGICLGAQFIAAASGSRVYPSGIKEIGFAPVTLTSDGLTGPLRHLLNVPVLHWHGDTYELPTDAKGLASTPQIAQQAFSIGERVLGLQFHPEVDVQAGFERWLVGHASELSQAKIDVSQLRSDAAQFGPELASASDRMFREWLRRAEAT